MSVFIAARRRRKKPEESWLVFGKEFWRRFQEDECPTRAAALAFTGVFALIPLLLMGLAVLGFLAPEPGKAVESMARLLAQLTPGTQAEKAIQEILQQARVEEAMQELAQKSVWAIAIGALSQLWIGVSLFVSASTPMNITWDVTETRGFLKLRFVCLAVFTGTAFLFLFSLFPTAGPDFVRNLSIPWLGLPESVPLWLDALFALLAVVIDVALFIFIYRFLPNKRVPWRVAFAGGAVAGLLWEAFKKGFAIYLAHFGNYNKLYGAFGGVALLVTWIWYSCIVLLAGAILCKMFDERWSERGLERRKRPSD